MDEENTVAVEWKWINNLLKRISRHVKNELINELFAPGHLYNTTFMTLGIINHVNNFPCFDAWTDSQFIQENLRDRTNQ